MCQMILITGIGKKNADNGIAYFLILQNIAYVESDLRELDLF